MKNKNEMRKRHHEVIVRNQESSIKRKKVLKERSIRERFIAPKREIYKQHEIERQEELKKLKAEKFVKDDVEETATMNNIEENKS